MAIKAPDGANKIAFTKPLLKDLLLAFDIFLRSSFSEDKLLGKQNKTSFIVGRNRGEEGGKYEEKEKLKKY